MAATEEKKEAQDKIELEMQHNRLWNHDYRIEHIENKFKRLDKGLYDLTLVLYGMALGFIVALILGVNP